MNIVFTFLYAVFYNCHHSLGFLKGQEFLDNWNGHNLHFSIEAVSHIFKLFIYKTQTNSYYQFYAVQNVYNRCVLCHVKRVRNHDLCGGVADLHGFCGM